MKRVRVVLLGLAVVLVVVVYLARHPVVLALVSVPLVLVTLAGLARMLRFATDTPDQRRIRWRSFVIARRWEHTARGLGLAGPDLSSRVRLRGERHPRRIQATRDGAALPIVTAPKATVSHDEHSVIVDAATLPGVGLAEYQRAAPYLADAWNALRVQAEQHCPGRVRLRAVMVDPLTAPYVLAPSGQPPAQLSSWQLGRDEMGSDVAVRLSGVSGVVIAGLAGYGKTCLVAHLLAQLMPSPAAQFVLVDGKGGPDYDELADRCWLFAKDDLDQVLSVLRQAHRLMVDRMAALRGVLGTRNGWSLGPSPSWPLVLLVIDEAHTFFHEVKASTPEAREHNAKVAEATRLVEEIVRKGRAVMMTVVLLTQKATADAIPTRIRDNAQVGVSYALRTVDAAVAALGESIRQFPELSPVTLIDPAYIGVCVTTLPGRPGFHRVRTPLVDEDVVAALAARTAPLRADPHALLTELTRPALSVLRPVEGLAS